MYTISRELDINEQIRARELRVINHDGEQLGVMSTEDALNKAMNLSMDLALISPAAKPPVAKIMNYGRFKYEQSMEFFLGIA